MNTLLSIKDFAEKLVENLKNARRVLVAVHANPDGDALASLAACAHILSHYKITFVLAAHEYDHEYLAQLPYSSAIQNDAKRLNPAEFDVVLLLDVHTFRRAELSHFPANFPSFAIDHHPVDRSADVASRHLSIRDYTSTCSILFEIFEALSIPVTHIVATVLLCGILTDCEKFQNHAANEHTFRQVGRLIGLGADISTVERFAFRTFSTETLQHIGRQLERVLVNPIHNAGLLVIEEDKGKLANIIKRTQFPKTTFVIRNNPELGRVEVSIRSPTTNVGALARLLGGGGHPKAAAFRFRGKLVEKEGKWAII